MPTCWHEACEGRTHRHDGGVIIAGRTRSGKRWFWAATDMDGPEEHGYTDTEAEAIAAYRAAAERIAGTRDTSGSIYAGHAAGKLKRLNAARRAAKPAPDTRDARTVEHLYFVYDTDELNGRTAYHVGTAQIIKKTPKRIYFRYENGVTRSKQEATRFLDREVLERDGEVSLPGGWWEPERHLYATEDAAQAVIDARTAPKPEPVDLAGLRRAAADAHPDRGGTDEAFRAAHGRYIAAKRRAKTLTAAD